MKKKEIAEVVEESFKILEKLRRKILEEFDADDIHDFRVEVKKLRAFLRLVNIKKDDDEPTIPKLLKTFYGYIGIVRNIHLLRHHLFKYITDSSAKKTTAFLKLMSSDEDFWKKEGVELMIDNNFKDVKEKILEALPGKLEKSRIKKFIGDKLSDLGKLLEDLDDDHQMHSTRKILKDILYTWRFTKHHADLPEIIAGEDKLKSLTSVLGDFMDKSVEIEFLQPSYVDKIKSKKEKSLLLDLKNYWISEKNKLREEFTPVLISLKEQLQDVKVSAD
ncbi:MAG TPA: CHAD domain-containing protein [Parafilimonas sp.]|nr:CHAD domain-containing protein [Parafilimonas sp.]